MQIPVAGLTGLPRSINGWRRTVVAPGEPQEAEFGNSRRERRSGQRAGGGGHGEIKSRGAAELFCRPIRTRVGISGESGGGGGAADGGGDEEGGGEMLRFRRGHVSSDCVSGGEAVESARSS
ncbi:hypothetical protein ACJRO7_030606 [Eucalyptus globulus]|uniref:Uncharacterized protein n=1 Tax=Eucalyptus globulus TaxID=34317 RepID=A0ABD3JEA2_EUCGL